MSKSFYITTTLPYVNSEPHIGFAMEIIRADIIARAKSLQGFNVFFNTGTDEHGLKIYEKAYDLGDETQEYVDRYVKKFEKLKIILNLRHDVHFIRTTDAHHIKSAQAFWKLCDKNGYIYKKKYKAKYCVGCEMERFDSELLNGRCFLHPNLDIIFIEEDNYFFKFSAFQKPLLDFYQKNPKFVVPNFRFNEIKAFVERGLEDFSISRLKSKMPWGIDVPGDKNHVMYVWFDALVSYISTLGWPENKDIFEKFWANGTPVQYCGKDNLRQQSAMWQAMLMSVGLPQTHTIVIDGFITTAYKKMSKSSGNIISPFDIVKKYGTDTLRYYMAREVSMFEDSDVTMEKIRDTYNANLANGLGNLVSRIMKMAEDNLEKPVTISESEDTRLPSSEAEGNGGQVSKYFAFLENFEIGKAADYIWSEIGVMDLYIQENEPFKMVKTDKKAGQK